MRTKTFLLSAAVLAAGLSASVAQSVFSVNAVGYVNIPVGVGYSLISNPLNGTNNLLSTIIPAPPDGTVVLKWNPVSQSFGAPSTFIEFLGAWSPDATVNPGEGMFINIPPGGATTLTFVGEVPQGPALSNPISGNYSLISGIVPQTAALNDPALSFPVLDGDIVLNWNTALQRFDAPLTYIEFLGAWQPTTPTNVVGRAFFYNTQTPRNWTRSFSVN